MGCDGVPGVRLAIQHAKAFIVKNRFFDDFGWRRATAYRVIRLASRQPKARKRCLYDKRFRVLDCWAYARNPSGITFRFRSRRAVLAIPAAETAFFEKSAKSAFGKFYLRFLNQCRLHEYCSIFYTTNQEISGSNYREFARILSKTAPDFP